jgi:hypothetical protein
MTARHVRTASALAALVAWVAAAVAAFSVAWWVVLGDGTRGGSDSPQVFPVGIPDGTEVSCRVVDARLVGCTVVLPPPSMGVAL